MAGAGTGAGAFDEGAGGLAGGAGGLAGGVGGAGGLLEGDEGLPDGGEAGLPAGAGAGAGADGGGGGAGGLPVTVGPGGLATPPGEAVCVGGPPPIGVLEGVTATKEPVTMG